MQIVDANVLLYAVNRDAPHHEGARQWLDRALAGSQTVGFAWVADAGCRPRTHSNERPATLSAFAAGSPPRIATSW